jgi:hypothetical protein
MRVSNIYFLITVVLILIPGFSVLDPYTAIGPLAFVLGMSMLREAYEDYVSYLSLSKKFFSLEKEKE